MRRVHLPSLQTLALIFTFVCYCGPAGPRQGFSRPTQGEEHEAYIPSGSRISSSTANGDRKSFGSLRDEELQRIAEQIELNETGGNPEKLVYWNEAETFPSLGIGHAIWVQKENTRALQLYGSSFPPLLEHLKAAGKKLPDFVEALAPDYYCPWPDRSTYLQDATIIKQREEMKLLMAANKKEQMLSIQERYQKAEETFTSGKNASLIMGLIEELKETPEGWYPLLDYVNFKGEGSDDPTSYGLKNALLVGAKSSESSPGAKIALGCREVLLARISRQPEVARFREGWMKRCNTYATFTIK